MIYITAGPRRVFVGLFFAGIMHDIVMHDVAPAGDAEIPDLNYIGLGR